MSEPAAHSSSSLRRSHIGVQHRHSVALDAYRLHVLLEAGSFDADFVLTWRQLELKAPVVAAVARMHLLAARVGDADARLECLLLELRTRPGSTPPSSAFS